MTKKYQVTENNGGGLTLYVWEDDKLIYAHAGYEYNPGQLTQDIQALNDGSDINLWDGNDLTNEDIITACRTSYEYDGEHIGDIFDDNGDIIPLTEDEYYDDHQSTKIICDNDGPIEARDMGRAGQAEFYPNLTDEEIYG